MNNKQIRKITIIAIDGVSIFEHLSDEQLIRESKEYKFVDNEFEEEPNHKLILVRKQKQK